MARPLIMVIVFSAASSLFAQSSASYKLDEHALNAGGRPAQAVFSSSPSYRLSLDSIGDPIAGRLLAGASYRMDGGFIAAYPPPGEVEDLELLADAQTLIWADEPASTTYNVYTGPLPTLPGGYGVCATPRVAATTWIDAATPLPGNTMFYLVTGENRLWEEGTKGYTSTGIQRVNPSPCP